MARADHVLDVDLEHLVVLSPSLLKKVLCFGKMQRRWCSSHHLDCDKTFPASNRNLPGTQHFCLPLTTPLDLTRGLDLWSTKTASRFTHYTEPFAIGEGGTFANCRRSGSSATRAQFRSGTWKSRPRLEGIMASFPLSRQRLVSLVEVLTVSESSSRRSKTIYRNAEGT